MWTNIQCFTTEESPYYPNKYVIKPVYNAFHLTGTKGSYNIICARLMGLTYAQYLRFCRDIVGAEIIGKNTMYPVAYFKAGARLNAFIRLLNTRANLVLWEREHPDYEKHKEEMFPKFTDEQLKRFKEMEKENG